MQKRIILFISILVFLSCQQSDKSSLLWEISGKGMKEPSYIFGTNHGFSNIFLEKVPYFYQVFNSVNQLIIEIDFDSLDIKKNIIFKNNKYTKFLPKGVKYSNLLNKKDILFLDSLLSIYTNKKAEDIPIRPNILYKYLKEEYIKKENILKDIPANDITHNSPLQYLAIINKKESMDIYILNQGKIKGYKTIALETLEYQLRLKFQANISLEHEAKSLIMQLKNQNKIIKKSDDIIAAYINQDLNKLMKDYDEFTFLSGFGNSYADSPVDEIKKRNLNWMPTIKSSISEKSSLIAVGAGHLPGEYGLIELLRKEGYTVKPLK